MGINDDAVRLARYVTDAARLRREIAPYELDRRGLDDGANISYAVDTNIVMLYLRPNAMGPRSQQGAGGYGAVFHDDPDESSQALAAVLSRFVFYNLTGNDTALILLPGHDAEVRGVYAAVFEEGFDSMLNAESQWLQLTAILEELSRMTDFEAQVEFLKQKTETLLALLYYSENVAVELSRFNGLLVDRRMLRLARALESEDTDLSPDVRAAYGAPLTLSEQVLESIFRVDWERRLKPERPSRSDRRLRPDCAALARLELINLMLRQRKINRRLVLITGDEAMLRTAADYKPIPDDPRTFSELYLRHPRAFLATPMVVLSGEARTGEGRSAKADFISDWLDTLLVRYTGDSGVHDARLRELVACSSDLKELAKTFADGDVNDEDLVRWQHDAPTNRRNALTLIGRARRVVRKDRDAPVRIKVQWENHFKQLAMEHAGASPIGRAALERALHAAHNQDADTALQDVDTALQDVDTALRDLNRSLLAEIEQTWASFNQELTIAGFELLLYDSSAHEAGAPITRKRNAPPIFIESPPWANCFVRLMAVEDNLFDLFVQKSKELRTLMEVEPTGYVQSLVYAMVFANAEKWHVAALFARRAISIAERARGPETSGGVSGREAYYLCSFATRIRAREESHLFEAEVLLAKAEAALIRDQKRNPDLCISMVRFQAERLALDLERYLLRRFCGKATQENSPAGPLEEVFARLVELHGKLKCEKEEWLRINVERRVVTNAFMIAAVMDTEGPLPQQVDVFCEQQWRSLCPPSGGGGSIPMTRLTSAVADYAVARFGKHPDVGIAPIYDRVTKLQRAVDDGDGTVLLTSYDRPRFDLLIRCTQSALSARG